MSLLGDVGRVQEKFYNGGVTPTGTSEINANTVCVEGRFMFRCEKEKEPTNNREFVNSGILVWYIK